jgi:hypothetical protein
MKFQFGIRLYDRLGSGRRHFNIDLASSVSLKDALDAIVDAINAEKLRQVTNKNVYFTTRRNGKPVKVTTEADWEEAKKTRLIDDRVLIDGFGPKLSAAEKRKFEQERIANITAELPKKRTSRSSTREKATIESSSSSATVATTTKRSKK